MPGDTLQSPALETDSSTTMEEREPPPRCGIGEGMWERDVEGKVLGSGDRESEQLVRGTGEESALLNSGSVTFTKGCEEGSAVG